MGLTQSRLSSLTDVEQPPLQLIKKLIEDEAGLETILVLFRKPGLMH